MTLSNSQGITDWEIVMLKRQKSYAVSAMTDSKEKVILINNFF